MDASPSTPTVLILDDEAEIRASLLRTLRGNGWRVLEASLPSEAAAIIARDHPEVILSDCQMPDMAGTEFLARVRDLSPDTVRILLTANAGEMAAATALDPGTVHYFLDKPWNDDALRALVRRAFTDLGMTPGPEGRNPARCG